MKTHDSCFAGVILLASVISLACSSPLPDCPSGCDCTTPNAAMAPCKVGVTTCAGNTPSFGACANGNEVRSFPTGCKAATEPWWDGSTYQVPTNCSGYAAQCYRERFCFQDQNNLSLCIQGAPADPPGGNWKSGNKWYADCCDDD